MTAGGVSAFSRWLAGHQPSVEERSTTLRLRVEVLGIRIAESGDSDTRDRLQAMKDKTLAELEGGER